MSDRIRAGLLIFGVACFLVSIWIRVYFYLQIRARVADKISEASCLKEGKRSIGAEQRLFREYERLYPPSGLAKWCRRLLVITFASAAFLVLLTFLSQSSPR